MDCVKPSSRDLFLQILDKNDFRHKAVIELGNAIPDFLPLVKEFNSFIFEEQRLSGKQKNRLYEILQKAKENQGSGITTVKSTPLPRYVRRDPSYKTNPVTKVANPIVVDLLLNFVSQKCDLSSYYNVTTAELLLQISEISSYDFIIIYDVLAKHGWDGSSYYSEPKLEEIKKSLTELI